jgi:hypothetical protein
MPVHISWITIGITIMAAGSIFLMEVIITSIIMYRVIGAVIMTICGINTTIATATNWSSSDIPNNISSYINQNQKSYKNKKSNAKLGESPGLNPGLFTFIVYRKT